MDPKVGEYDYPQFFFEIKQYLYPLPIIFIENVFNNLPKYIKNVWISFHKSINNVYY